ncbi:hypothetical protein COU19_02870 [Candidatus Kaiserbacteria bacterium CG10_big_fil_rev_8_21_14_0_10_56_12]|uniref:Peptidase M14 domain-containing protein n=1 Tax=Candidatus Kaiserbacteria bacterium CG10_big_fil_rev_8_21_14_0_10_56_12 TaxID=1974611 RepID=A0A2H0U9C0_9BACT|nr:MAG: hypothetical protein COU19_02870 [Candidatus Kaiserbacteria bacterium CG10_big_fil_rev_8_21_14_0_10_56_12]
MKNISLIGSVLVLVLLGVGAYFVLQSTLPAPVSPGAETATSTPQTATTTPVATESEATGAHTIGTSVKGLPIMAYHYGTGATRLLFVAGLHGGYEWNTVLVAYDLIDYLDAHPEAIAPNESVTVIPVVNPDGLTAVVGTEGRFSPSAVPTPASKTVVGRFNANQVDLNRNFDCDWHATGIWQNKSVNGGSAAFSEPESQAIRKYVETYPPTAVVVWYSAAGGVYASSCHDGVLPETNTLTQVFADASGYKAYQSFDFYATTGDMVNWLAKSRLPAISVLLTNHTDTEWSKNQAGVLAVLKHYAQ